MNDKRMPVLLDKVDTLGWSVYEDESGWDIRKASPAGEDFGFFVHKSDVKDAGDFIREVRQYANDFDPDENIEMWVEARKSGTRGIPEIRTLVQDADDIQDTLDELAGALESNLHSSTEEDAEEAGKLKLNEVQLARRYEIDNAMYEFLRVLLEKDEREFPWDMEYISEAIDMVSDFMYEQGFDIHRPEIILDGDGSYIIEGDYHKRKERGEN